MKKYFLIPVTLIAAVLFLNFNKADASKDSPVEATSEFSIPEDVQAVIDNSCYGCHNSDSKNIKGKGKLKFDELGELKTYKLVGKLGNIADVIKEDDMPPKKFLKNYPDKELTQEQKDLVINWAKTTAKAYSE